MAKNQDIINCLKTNYGIKVSSLKPLALGADINASVYRAENYFIKLKSGQEDDIGLITLSMLHDAGIEQIIPPIKTNTGHLSSAIGPLTLIVYPFVEGQDGFSRNLTDDQWFTLGKVLRQVHEFQVAPAILAKLKMENYSDKWRKKVRALLESSGEGKFWTVLNKHRDTIERLVDRAEELSQKMKKLSPEFVLCHSDIHGGNVIISQDGAIHIVDWDDPIMAPKERDLMFIGGGVANIWNQPHEEELFYKGYGKTEINREILAYYRHERIVQDIAEFSEEFNEHHFIAMFEPRGVIDIAFKTL